MGTGHLHGQRSYNLVFRRHRLDVGEGRVYGYLGNAAAWQPSGGLQVEHRCLDERARRRAQRFSQTFPPILLQTIRWIGLR